jgi:hypothetical protein
MTGIPRMTGMQRVVVLAVGLAVGSAGLAMAGPQRPNRVSDQQLKDLVHRIDTHRDAFHVSIARAVDRSPIKGSPTDTQIEKSVKDFERATDRLRDRVNDRQSDTADAEQVLRRASVIDDLMRRHQLDARAQSDWQALRLDMNDLERAYGITWSWTASSQSMPVRVDDRQIERLLRVIGEKADRFDNSLGRAFDGRRTDDRGKAEIRQSVKDFKQATARLRGRVAGRQSNALDVDEVLRRGASIDRFMQRHQLSAQSEQSWITLRGDLDTLARAYNVAWNWGAPGYTPGQPGAGFHGLTGTYQLESTGGDDARRAAEQAVRGTPSGQRTLTYERILRRLEAPDLIAIERHENQVTIASTRGPRVTVEADGRDQVERWSGEQTMRTRATLEGRRLVVTTTGNRGSDFTVTFDPTEDGRGLHMTRTIDDEALRQPVTVRSAYRRLSEEARWNIDVSGQRDPDDRFGSPEEVAVPDGTRLVALLDTALSTANARDRDIYTMTVRSPSRYAGAVIQGVVARVHDSGRQAGRADLTLSFQNIRLRDGRSYRFDGVIENIRTPDGDTVRVDREGTVDQQESRTQKAVERGAIGAALGAIIGAVAGGGKGAAIGAVIGAGGGASTVMIEGRDRLDLPRGTEFTITSGEPRRVTSLGVQR